MYDLRADASPPASKTSKIRQRLRIILPLLICLVMAIAMAAAPAAADQAAAPAAADQAAAPEQEEQALLPHTYIRYEAHTRKGRKNLRSLKKALATMRDLGCEDSLSWYYQGAIHWVPTSHKDISGIENGNPLCEYYSGFSKAEEAAAKLLASWDNCTHDSNQAGQSSKVHFLPWHRLYVYHFEKIVRELSDDPDFAMPYWGYISLSDKRLPDEKWLKMPRMFRKPADDNNSLYESARYSWLQDGNPIEDGFAQASLLKAVKDLSKKSRYQDFNGSINEAPHGEMHNYIGSGCYNMLCEEFDNKIYNKQDNGLMANVPSAGFDPIFWMHHGNIDRLWAQWTDLTGVKVTAEELQKVSWPYQFFEPDGSVKAYTMEEVVNTIYDMDYEYANPNGSIVKLASEDSLGLRTIQSEIPREPIKVGSVLVGEPVGSDLILTETVPLPEFSPTINRLFQAPQADSADSLSQPNFTLNVEVTYTGRPLGYYEVYLSLASDEEPITEAMLEAMDNKDKDAYLLGAISFFVLDSPLPRTNTFQFDLTEELQQQLQNLYNSGANPVTDSVKISILQKGGLPDENLIVNSFTIYEE